MKQYCVLEFSFFMFSKLPAILGTLKHYNKTKFLAFFFPYLRVVSPTHGLSSHAVFYEMSRQIQFNVLIGAENYFFLTWPFTKVNTAKCTSLCFVFVLGKAIVQFF